MWSSVTGTGRGIKISVLPSFDQQSNQVSNVSRRDAHQLEHCKKKKDISSVRSESNPSLPIQKTNFLKILYYITKISNNLKRTLNHRKYQLLNWQHFYIINDKSHYFKQPEKMFKVHKQIKGMLFFPQISPFSPTSTVVVIWYVIILAILLIQLFFIPMKASFTLILSEGFSMYFLRIIPAIAFSIEILLKFNTGYYEEGQIVMDRNKIIRTYLKTTFWIDLTATTSILAN